MTLSEFKSWFDGFTESLEGVPTEKQWDRIKQRVDQITGQPVTYPVFVDRYVPYYPSYPRWGSLVGQAQCVNANAALASGSYASNQAFNSHSAMNDLGRSEALLLKQEA